VKTKKKGKERKGKEKKRRKEAAAANGKTSAVTTDDGKSGGDRKRYSRGSILQGTTYLSKCVRACVKWLSKGGLLGVVASSCGGDGQRGLFEKGLTGFRAGLNLTVFSRESGDSGFGKLMALREVGTSSVRSWEVGAVNRYFLGGRNGYGDGVRKRVGIGWALSEGVSLGILSILSLDFSLQSLLKRGHYGQS